MATPCRAPLTRPLQRPLGRARHLFIDTRNVEAAANSAGPSKPAIVLAQRHKRGDCKVAQTWLPAVERYAHKHAVFVAVALVTGLSAHGAYAEELNPAYMDVFESWLDTVKSLGSLGPLLFIGTVAVFECIPLFPTQPLSLAAGLVFGILPGACYNLVGVTCAASLAFYISRTMGRDMAERVIEEETAGDSGGAVAAQLAKVKDAIANGSSMEQYSAMTLLRLTPIVPFSASNYVLGLTPVAYAPFFAATLTGMTVWSTVYASVGAAGRSLLESGFDLEAVVVQLGEQAGDVSEKAAIFALVLGLCAAGFYVVRSKTPANDN